MGFVDTHSVSFSVRGRIFFLGNDHSVCWLVLKCQAPRVWKQNYSSNIFNLRKLPLFVHHSARTITRELATFLAIIARILGRGRACGKRSPSLPAHLRIYVKSLDANHSNLTSSSDTAHSPCTCTPTEFKLRLVFRDKLQLAPGSYARECIDNLPPLRGIYSSQRQVVGVGGGGGNAVVRMTQQSIPGVEFWCLNTDAQVGLQQSQGFA